MHLATRDAPHSAETSEERSLLALARLGAVVRARSRNGQLDDEMTPQPVPLAERIRRMPEALLLTAGYYASRAPAMGDLARRLRERR
jgi:hypothetical protein